METGNILRIAAISDIHYTRKSQGSLLQLFSQITRNADVFLLCGDSTDMGLPDEAHILARDLTEAVKIPIISVLGNHDFESARQDEVSDVLQGAGINVLDGGACEVQGIGFAGVKGFAGGFGRQALQPWGEEIIKHFVQEAVNESLKLEAALSKLHTSQRIALLHYAPIKYTLEGESPEIFTYLGTSRLEEPLNRWNVSAVFHGHAHGGSPEGRTGSGIPVYNVSRPVLLKSFPGRPPYRLVEIPREQEVQ